MSGIRNFLYRFPRFQADCRMDFIHGDSIVLGICSNLSESGLRGTFAEPITPGAEGMLTLYYGEQKVEMKAKVFVLRDDEVRVQFLFANEEEREAISELLKLLSSGPTA